MEVLFAIGVLMVGILGIAAVLPVGTKNAAGALRTDASTSAIENQVSNAMARVGGRPETILLPIPSLQGFNTGDAVVSGLATETRPVQPNQRYVSASVGQAGNALPSDDISIAGPNDAPIVAPAFCIDPAFLAAANNLRNDVGAVNSRVLNSYDRTKFPCYDFNYNPTIAPGLQMNSTTAWPITPRMLRVSVSPQLTTAPTDAVARVLLSERDGLPLTKTKDKTQSPGLLFNTFGASGAMDVQKTGAYSSMVTFAPTSATATNYDVSVIVYESRQLTAFNTTSLSEDFVLAPFTPAQNSTVWPLKSNTNIEPPTYGDEVMGVVTATQGLIENGVGTFQFAQSSRCNPEVKVGQWLMLTRFDVASGINRYAWYRISDIITPPYLDPSGDMYIAKVEVRGQDWLYHPFLTPPVNLPLGGTYPNPITEPGARRHATYVIKCPKVVSVRTMTL